MAETTEQRIERVARAIRGTADFAGWDRLLDINLEQMARAADAISFAAGWNAAVETLRNSSEQAYLAAHRPGETT